MAAVVVTHDAQLASWADRVVFLRDGRIVDQTAPLPGPESLLAPDPPVTLVRPATAVRSRRTGGGRMPARRAFSPLGWRLFRREWRQQVLVLALLACRRGNHRRAGIGVNVQSTDQALLGTANLLIDIANPGRLRRCAGHRGGAERASAPSSHRTRDCCGARLGHPGRPARAGPARRLFGQPMLRLVRPAVTQSAAGQAGRRPRSAATFSLKIGDSRSVNGRTLR